MKANPEKTKLVLAKLAYAKVIPPGEYVMHKRSKYSVLMSIRDDPSTSKGKRAIEDVVEVQESPKRQRVGKEVQTSELLYSPSNPQYM